MFRVHVVYLGAVVRAFAQMFAHVLLSRSCFFPLPTHANVCNRKPSEIPPRFTDDDSSRRALTAKSLFYHGRFDMWEELPYVRCFVLVRLKGVELEMYVQ